MKEQIKTNLLELPTTILNKEKHIIDAEDLLAENKLIMETAKLTVYEDIEKERIKAKENNETDPYSNQTKRDVECERRVNDRYSEVLKANDTMSKQLKIDKIELEYLKRKFRSYECLAVLGVD